MSNLITQGLKQTWNVITQGLGAGVANIFPKICRTYTERYICQKVYTEG